MKLKQEYMLAEIAGEYVAVATNSNLDSERKIIRMNDTGKLIWDGIANGKDERAIVSDLMDQYEVDEQTAAKSVARILQQMIDTGIVEN
ncbi:MAG: PqqD family protein [Clostridia bacterium]|nr:PqqD family protein [Clostridia bacterium]